MMEYKSNEGKGRQEEKQKSERRNKILNPMVHKRLLLHKKIEKTHQIVIYN